MTANPAPVVYVAIMETCGDGTRWLGDGYSTRAGAKMWGQIIENGKDDIYRNNFLGTRAVPLEPDSEGKI